MQNKEEIDQIAIFTNKDGNISVDAKLSKDTLWLSLNQLVELFGRDKSVISRHLKKIFSENELEENSVVAKYATTAADGKTYQVDYYNLDVIISVGYRVNSERGIEFRRWANGVLKDYLIKGYSINSYYSGLASGDDDLNYGAWIKGFIGKETDKANIGINSNTSRSRSDIHGFVIGADTKIDEDLTIGLAYSNIASNTKQKISGISTNNDKISSHTLSIYGSSNIDEDISLNGNVAYGKAFIKTTHTGVARSSKQKGDLFGSNLTANYKLYQGESIIVEPRAGISYSNLKMKGYQDGSIKIAKISNRLDQNILSQKISNNKGAIKLGAGLNVLADRVELGGGYEHVIQDKSRAHIGYIKLRVNF